MKLRRAAALALTGWYLMTPPMAVAQHCQPGYEFPQFTDAEKLVLARTNVCGEQRGEHSFINSGLGTKEDLQRLELNALTDQLGITDAETIMAQARADLAVKKWSLKDCTRLGKQGLRLQTHFAHLINERTGSQ